MTDWTEIERARAKAHAKHGDNSIERLDASACAWLPVLTEEVGEVAHELTYDATGGSLRAELVDVLAVASAWIDALDGRALLSQPEPTAEPDDDDVDDEEFCARCYAGVDSNEHHEKCVITGYAEDGESAAEPHRIEDLAPGTFLTVQMFGSVTPHRVCVVHGNRSLVSKVDRLDGRSQYIAVEDIDPSTIRDVTPPPATPEGDDRA